MTKFLDPIELVRQVIHYFDIESELENHDSIHEDILKGIVFKGTNLWILFFAIIVASVGLNVNSTAVIIGAMLISPLMGPINGMGYSIATYNSLLFRQSVKNFTFAVVIGLLGSTLYFALSPISTAQSELLARTSPTIYDVIIAFFGGLAGIVAISSKQKGNVIPGVAIATALMPPLCTAGYGLATGQYTYFFGALYLFTINTVFIAIASVVISQVLKFPIRTLVDTAQKKRINRLISFVILLVFLPSVYFGYGLVQQERFANNANRYVNNVSTFEGRWLLKQEIEPRKKQITLIYGGNMLTEEQKTAILEKADQFDLTAPKVIIKQGLTTDEARNESASIQSEEVLRLREELSRMSLVVNEKDAHIDSLQNQGVLGRTLLKEIRNLYPQIKSCSYANSYIFRDSIPTPEQKAIVLYSLNGSSLSKVEKDKIESWTKIRLQQQVKIIYE